ncbi:MAG: hypothetical protein AABW51_03365 [Nanoarchaeota archaeon]
MVNYSDINMSTIVIVIILVIILVYLLIKKRVSNNDKRKTEVKEKEIIDIKRKEAKILRKLTKDKKDVESKLKRLNKKVSIGRIKVKN